MLAGIALAHAEIPQELIEQHGLSRRVHDRGGAQEVRFLLPDRERILPVWLDGQLKVVRWGQSPHLPFTAWTRLETVEKGGWGELELTQVVIPAAMGLDGGIWFPIQKGLRGLLVRDERGALVVYVLVEPATHYYQMMTHSQWMPALSSDIV